MKVYELSGAKSHTQFGKLIESLVHDKEAREAYYDKLWESGIDDSIDLFRDYFEELNAERKSNKQDYTPTEVAELMASLVQPDARSIYDGAAGSGTLIVAAWTVLKKPADFYAHTWEYADNVLPYLIHNLAYRNIRADVIHGDTLTQEVFRRYELRPAERYSEVILCD